MSLGIKRTPAETQQQLRRLEIRSNEADKKKLRKKKGIKEHPNVIWNMLDPHRYEIVLHSFQSSSKIVFRWTISSYFLK